MKRLGGFVFALLLLLTLAPWSDCAGAESRSGTYGENIRWELDSGTGTLTLSGSGAMEYLDDTPWWHIRQEVRYLVIGDGITGVSARAFYYSENLEEVILPEGLEVIGAGAFAYCRRLAKINFPDSLRYISNEAFYCCVSLEEAVLPENLKSIGSEAFFGCRALKSLQIPCVASLGDGAFSGCVALEEAQVAKGVTLFPSRLFENCTSLKTVVIPDSVTSIVSDAFLGCTALGTVPLPEDINIIGDQEKETAPEEEPAPEKGVTWKFDARTGTLTISGYGDMFQYSNEEKYPWYPYRDHIRHLVVERSVTGIGSYAFRGYEKLETVSLFYYGLEIIGEGAFQGCTSLTLVRLPRSVEYIRREAFRDCTSLERITLPTLLWKIESRAFYGCEKLSDVELTNDFVQIDSSAFSRCPVPASVRQYVFLQNYGAVISLTALLIASTAVLAAGILLYRAEGSRKRLLGRAAVVCGLTGAVLTCAVAMMLMDLPAVTKAYGSPLMWLPSLLPEPWNLIVIDYLEYVFQGFCCVAVVFGIAVHQWFCTGEALRSSGKLPYGSRVARMAILAGSFGALALWCYLTWRGRQEGWASYEELSVIFPVGILCGLAAVLLPGWKRGRELIVKKRGIAFAGAGLVGGLWLLAPIPGILEKYSIFIMEVWRMGLLVLAVACGAIAVYFLACAVYNGWKYRDREESTVDWGRIARVGIIVAAVVIGYMIFCVLARGNFESEYFAEQITVTHVYEDSEERTVYCVDFVREELQFYTQDADGNRELHWTKPLTTEALDEFVETCNREGLLSLVERSVGEKRSYDYDFVYVTTYSARGERVVYSSTLYSGKKLNQAFYDLTGIYCLDMP